MTHPEKLAAVREAVIRAVPDILKLEFGCEVRRIFWYKSEKDKKAGKIDWLETGYHEDGRRGTVVKDLRSDFLPMWIDYGDQLEFQIQPNDIVSMEILGRTIHLADCYAAMWIGEFANEEQLKEEQEKVHQLAIMWPSTDDLNLASPECISFLYDIFYPTGI